MLKRLLAVAFAALLSALAGFGLIGLAMPGAATSQSILMVAAAVLFVSVAAAALALTALVRANAMHGRLQHLAKSVDAAMRDFTAQRNRDVAMISDLDARLTHQLERLPVAMPALQASADDDRLVAQADNVVPHPATRRMRTEPQPAAPPPMVDAVAALQRAVLAGSLELALQPIVSIAKGAAAGFEVFVHLSPEGGDPVDLRRIAEPVDGLSQAAFERLFVVTAAEAARRRLGIASEAMPLHVAISPALLADEDELACVVDMVNRYPVLAQAIVLSVPADLIETPGAHSAALDRLVLTGVRFAAEGWIGSDKGVEALRRNSVSFIKLPADRLLDRARQRKAEIDVATLLEMVTGVGVAPIATDVRSDDDAVGLIDLGIGLMTGARFSGPRLLKPQDGRERIA